MTEPVARTVKDFCQAYGVGKTLTYELIASGALVAKKAGNRTLITEESAKAWYASLPVNNSVHKRIADNGELARTRAER